MKCILSYFLLCAYAAIMIKPAIPTLADAFAHLLQYSDHIATVHHDHGEYHVHYEYLEAAKNNPSEENSTKPSGFKKCSNQDEHLISNTSPSLTPAGAHPYYLIPQIQSLPVVVTQKDLRPPIIVLV